MADEEIVTILEKIERKRFFIQIQAQAEKEGHVPRMPFLFLRKLSKYLQYTGGILLGIFLGIFTLILTYLSIVYFLHLQL